MSGKMSQDRVSGWVEKGRGTYPPGRGRKIPAIWWLRDKFHS